MQRMKSILLGMLMVSGVVGGELLEKSSVSLPTICAVGVIILPASVAFGRAYQKILLRLDQGDKDRNEIKETLSRLPCSGIRPSQCSEEQHRKGHKS